MYLYMYMYVSLLTNIIKKSKNRIIVSQKPKPKTTPANQANLDRHKYKKQSSPSLYRAKSKLCKPMQSHSVPETVDPCVT